MNTYLFIPISRDLDSARPFVSNADNLRKAIIDFANDFISRDEVLSDMYALGLDSEKYSDLYLQLWGLDQAVSHSYEEYAPYSLEVYQLDIPDFPYPENITPEFGYELREMLKSLESNQ